MRSTLVIRFALALSLLAPAAARACSMCRCDDPASTVLGNPLLVSRGWRLSIENERFDKFAGIVNDSPPLGEREAEWRTTVTGSWTFRPQTSLVARVPYSVRRLESDGIQRSHGFSDPELMLNWCALKSPGDERPAWVTFNAGVRAPLGANELQRGVGRMDEHLQSGTGAWGGSAGLTLFSRPSEHDAFYGSTMLRVNGVNTHGYHYGNAVVTSAGLQREVNSGLQLGAEMDLRVSTQDRDGLARDPNTGGTILYVTPRAQIALPARIALRLGVQIPVARQLNGDQREFPNVQTSVVLLP